MRKVIMIIAALALTGAACGGGDTADGGDTSPQPTATSPGGATSVNVKDNVFVPRDITVKAGQTVTWTWDPANSQPHNVIGVENTQLNSGELTPKDEPYSFTFNTAGTFTYYCQAHGTRTGSGMAGKVTVTA